MLRLLDSDFRADRGDDCAVGRGDHAAVLLTVSGSGHFNFQGCGIGACHAGILPAGSGLELPLIGQILTDCGDREGCGVADFAGVILRVCSDLSGNYIR